MQKLETTENSSITRMQTLIAIISKRLNLSWEPTGFLAIFILKTEKERAQFALWLNRTQETNLERIIAKAQEIAACNAAL